MSVWNLPFANFRYVPFYYYDLLQTISERIIVYTDVNLYSPK
uniref:Uncharacterized protein n=1 Tax=Anguilla anguilla TaxID=7936 RepID=A0A0E9V5W7_ANGAN